MMRYTMRYVEVPAGFTGYLVEMPKVIAQAKTLEDLRTNIKQSLDVALEILREDADDETPVFGWENAETERIEL